MIVLLEFTETLGNVSFFMTAPVTYCRVAQRPNTKCPDALLSNRPVDELS